MRLTRSLLTLHFLKVCKKIERELHEKKRSMATVIDVTNIAYEARDQARSRWAAAHGSSHVLGRRRTRSLLSGPSQTGRRL